MRGNQHLTATPKQVLGAGLITCALLGCGLENAPNRSFVDPEPPVEGLRGQEWVPETVAPLKVGSGIPVNGFDFEIKTLGAQRVVRGNHLIFSIQIIAKLGTLSGRRVSFSASGLPLEVSVRYPLLQGALTLPAETKDQFGIVQVPIDASRGLVQLKITATIDDVSRTADHFFRIEPFLREIPTFAGADNSVRGIPYLENFRRNVVNFGATHCPRDGLTSTNDGIWTWDGLRAYELSARAFSSLPLLACANKLRVFFESNLNAGTFVPNRIYTLGLESSHLRLAQNSTLNALKQAASSYLNLRPQSGEVLKSSLGMLAMISALRQKVDVTFSPSPWLLTEAESIDLILGHLDQILISQNAERPVSLSEIGLLIETLIDIHSLRPDPRIPHYLWVGLERLWQANWQEKKVGLISSFPNPGDKSVDLSQNLQIAGGYAWLYQLSGAAKWQDRADALFEGGVRFGKFDDPILFSAQLRFAHDYLKWRATKPRTDSTRAF